MNRKGALGVHLGTLAVVVFGYETSTMTLLVHTYRVTYSGADRLDITRKSAGPDGIAFAPSWAILRPMLELRRAEGKMSTDYAWPRYVIDYTAEMRTSYREQRPAWDALLARDKITLVCYCVDPDHCHRTVLAGILGKLGATVHGERAARCMAPREARRLNDGQLDLLAGMLETELTMRRGRLP